MIYYGLHLFIIHYNGGNKKTNHGGKFLINMLGVGLARVQRIQLVSGSLK